MDINIDYLIHGQEENVMDKISNLTSQISESTARITNECIINLILLTGEKVDKNTPANDIKEVVNRMSQKDLQIKIDSNEEEEIIIGLYHEESMIAGYKYKLNFDLENEKMEISLEALGLMKPFHEGDDVVVQ